MVLSVFLVVSLYAQNCLEVGFMHKMCIDTRGWWWMVKIGK